MATNRKKEFLTVGGVSVLRRAALPFVEARLFTRFVVTYPEGLLEETRDALGEIGLPVLFVTGGMTRQASVLRGLEALSPFAPDCVLIHDGARPWVSRDLILAVASETLRSGAAAPSLPPVDAMKSIGPDGTITRHFGRGELACIQTPQGFGFPAILEAHRRAASEAYAAPDDTELYARYIGRVKTVQGSPENRKITFPCDLEAR